MIVKHFSECCLRHRIGGIGVGYREQIENFPRFEQLTRELIQLGEQMYDRSGPRQEKKQRKLAWKPKQRFGGF